MHDAKGIYCSVIIWLRIAVASSTFIKFAKNTALNGTSATYKQDNALTKEISLITNLGYEKNITENGNFTAGLTAKNTNQDVKSLSGNLGFKLKF